MTVPDTTALENGKTYTTTLPRTLPGDGDVNIVDKTTTKASFDKSKIIITSQADTWQSASQKTKTIVRYIYDGSFSYGGDTLGSLSSTSINQITYALYSYEYNPSTNGFTQELGEGVASFRFSQPYKSLSGAIPVSTSGTLVYNYGKNGYSPALMLGGTRFSSEIISEDRSIVSLDPSYSELKPDWWVDPFSTSSIGSASDAKTFNTKTGADALTGVNKSSDTFAFGSPPEYGSLSDKITNFSSKDKDILQFSKSAFGVSVGNFAIAKTQKKLNKVLASDVDIVYNQSKGELIFNANGPEAGFGVDGGVFAQLVGAPKLTAAAVSFI